MWLSSFAVDGPEQHTVRAAVWTAQHDCVSPVEEALTFLATYDVTLLRLELFPRPLHCAAVLGKHDATEVVPGDPS